MKILKYIVSLLGIIMFTAHAYAEFKFENAPRLVSQEENSIKVTWDKLDGAFGYYIYYGTQSVADNEDVTAYEFELDDLIEGTGYTIKGLEAGKTYYVSVVGMDEEAEQTPYSDELKVVFGNGNEEVKKEASSTGLTNEEDSDDSLKLEDVTFTSDKTMFLSFNKELDDSDTAERDIKVTDLSTGEELDIDSIALSEKKFLDITFPVALKTNTEYEVTVVALSDLEGNNIEVGAYGTSKVMSPATFEEEEVVEEEVVEEPLEAAPIEPKKLPDTGAKEIFLVLAALLLGALLLNFRTRES